MLCRLMYGFCAHDSSRTSRVPWAPAIWASSAGGDQVLRMIEDDAQADPLGRVFLHQDSLDELVQQGEDHVGIAGPGLGLADPLADEGRTSAAADRRRRRRTSWRPWLRSCRSTTSQVPKSWVARKSATLP